MTTAALESYRARMRRVLDHIDQFPDVAEQAAITDLYLPLK